MTAPPTTPGRTARRSAAVLGAAALMLTGCAGGPAASPEPGSPAPIAWTECGPNLDCATIEVPLEYTDPDGEKIPLAVKRHRTTDPAQRIGSLFINSGGPGVPATDTIESIAPGSESSPFSPALLARFDVVGMDPRGVGDSGAVRCLTDEQRAELATDDLDPTVPGGKPLPELLADTTTFTEGCLAHHRPEYLASLSTDNVARDMDRLRAALGEEKISFYGMSYGTVVGPTYATLFPDRVRQMVIDAPVHTGLWRNAPLELLDDVSRSNEQTLDAWFETCRTEGPQVCPFGDGKPEAAFDALIKKLEKQPLQVPPVEGLTPGGRLDGAVALEAVRAGAGAPVLWPTLTAGLLAAQQGNGTLLHFLVSKVTVAPFGGPYAVLQEPHTAVRCADWATPTDIAAHTAVAEKIADRDERLASRAGYSALNCAKWPAPNKDHFAEPLTGAGAPPILVVGGRVDNVSPYHWAEAMTETLENSVLLTREGVGHTSYRRSGPCIDNAVDATLIDGVLPAEGTVCAALPSTTKPPAPAGK
ncbi:alpha/beta hydrolase [Amycolatopsis sp. YIM 10]|uniref:alpha/beta hydrolase n=1 Tax=Amycolatopsis sp. YIM 10 TaxID=2653857 RepID=UPI001D14512F|nr:alpha/beta hydrolase [Amycolatopsis sp. YIM 10]